MNARIYTRCDICGAPVKLPRRVFHAMTASQQRVIAMFLCAEWREHPDYRKGTAYKGNQHETRADVVRPRSKSDSGGGGAWEQHYRRNEGEE